VVTWSIPAKHDLKKIHDYIAEDSKYYALKVSQEFVARSETLFDFPEMGRMVPEIEDPNIRELIIYSYRLTYEVSSSHIEILAIIHCKQNFTGDFEELRK
jgi:plasmid stabilization system protein ParE